MPQPAPARRWRRGCRTWAFIPFRSRRTDERAQLFMNQGLNLTFGFNHAEAGRAFAEAARLDPTLAMAHWGQALVLGPNINAPMDPAAEAPAYEQVQKAIALKANAAPRERAYDRRARCAIQRTRRRSLGQRSCVR